MLNKNDKIAIVVCSNGKKIEDKNKLKKLERVLKNMDLIPVFSQYIYEDFFGRSTSAKVRSNELIKFFEDKNIKAIFDISGGDIANEILEFLDYKIIKENNKPFFGYSDVSVILNAITTKTENKTYLYQILNIIESEEIREKFQKSLLENKEDLFYCSYKFLQGETLEGKIVGGNIRCFLKLAGTQYFPNLDNKVLFIEGLGTTIQGLITHLAQLKQLGAFENISGLLIGTFTKIEREYSLSDIENIIKDFVPKNIPIAKTQDIGHSKNSQVLIIGKNIRYQLSK
ncbi:S66 family peptidase [Gemella cuniculi]|uniref:S66 family peptidase n=1 Tax=Gemella cuniculi TaxID=150240 RepID=UPI00040CE935|nr:S66 peptidase family protein [Gemella cuniculi]